MVALLQARRLSATCGATTLRRWLDAQVRLRGPLALAAARKVRVGCAMLTVTMAFAFIEADADEVAIPRSKPIVSAGEAPTPGGRSSDVSRGASAREGDRDGAAAVSERALAAGPGDGVGCERALSRRGARFEVIGAIADGTCGAPRALAFEGTANVTVQPAATVRCSVALATARWLEEVVQPAARLHLGKKVDGVAAAASYSCRTRRNGSGTTDRLSEHAFANAIDVSAIVLNDGTRVPVKARPDSPDPERAFQAAIRGGACAYFSTVIGPTTDAAHDDHLHFDLAPRRGGSRYCR